jgi:hypothetical protein
MTSSKIVVFLTAALAWSVAVAALGAASLPRGGWPYVLAHAPRYAQLGVLWVLIPVTFVLLLMGRVEPLAGFLRRVLQRGRPVPSDRRRWSDRIAVVLGGFMAAVQTIQTVGLVLFWRFPAYAAAVKRGPHLYGIPNPHHWLTTLPCVAVSLLVAWMGNGLPKLQSPFKGAPEPYDWSKMIRDCGRVMTLGGLAGAASAAFLPFPLGFWAGAAILLATMIVPGLIWAAYRIVGGPTRLKPGRMS